MGRSNAVKALLSCAALLAAMPAHAVSFSLTVSGETPGGSLDRPSFALTNTSAGNAAGSFITSFSLTLATGLVWNVDRVFAWDGTGNVNAPALTHVFVTPNGGTPSDPDGNTADDSGAMSPTAQIDFGGFNPGDTARWRIDNDLAIILPFDADEPTDFRLTLMGAVARVQFAGGESRSVRMSPVALGLDILTRDRTYTVASPADIVTAVPEPASWAMMMAGFGLVGFAARRRARQTIAA